MPTCDLYDQTGTKKGTLTLPENIFSVEIKPDLMHRALILQQSNRRIPYAHTQTRGEVTCSKRKIRQQKGSGGARHGQRSANIFRGGGVVFGPRNTRNFTKQLPRRSRRLALFSALSDASANSRILGLSELKLSSPSTKDLNSLLNKLPLKRKTLIILPERNETISLSARNLPNVKTIQASYLNIEDLLTYDHIIITQETITRITETFHPDQLTPGKKTTPQS